MEESEKYTAVIRTLGTAGQKYIRLLDSLNAQTLPPEDIIVYIADGYKIPEGTPGNERYVYVKKGMVAQRALDYAEVTTDIMLFLDDDVCLEPDAVEEMLNALRTSGADVVSPDTFRNSARSTSGKIIMALTGRMRPRKDDGKWAYKVMRNGGYSYNTSPSQKIYLSQTNAGPCFLCRKEDFLKIRFEEESWLDEVPYAQGDDQAMFYKMYLYGLKEITLFTDKVVHLDAGTAMNGTDRDRMRIYADFRFKTIFWKRFIYGREQSAAWRLVDIICIGSSFVASLAVSFLKFRWGIMRIKWKGIKDGFRCNIPPYLKR